MSRVCTASGDESEKHDTLNALKTRFPEIPEQVVASTLSKHSASLEKCITILSQESDRYLYGEQVESDSPVQVQPNPPTPSPSAPMEPLSITIPPTTSQELQNNYGYGPMSLIPVTRPLTIAIPSSSGTSMVSEPHTMDRHPSVDPYTQKLVQHQQQRVDRIKRELENERQKLSKLHHIVQKKEEELYNTRFKVAKNPSKTHVVHLQEETQVLRNEVDQMANEIDKLNNGASRLGIINQNENTQPFPSSMLPPNSIHPRFIPPGCPPQIRKSLSFPRDSRGHNNPRHPPPYPIQRPPYPVNGMPGMMPMPWYPPRSTGEEPFNSNQSPTRDPSLEGQGWILVPPGDSSYPSNLTPTSTSNNINSQPPQQDDTEQPWQCKHCTLENHGALHVCEACDMPRGRLTEL